jgi:hypothetical protein
MTLFSLNTEARVVLHLLPDDPPSPPDLPLPHQHGHPWDEVAQDIIIFKGLVLPQGDLTS